jgi:glycogen debranching enzyme
VALAALDTAVGGGAVIVTGGDGTITPESVTGLYRHDRRLLSRLRMSVVDHRLDLLGTAAPGPDRRMVHWLAIDPSGRRRALVTEDRRVDGGLALRLILRAFDGAARVVVRVEVATDLADLLRLRYDEAPPPMLPYHVAGERLLAGDGGPGVTISAPGAEIEPRGALSWSVAVAPGAPARVGLDARPRPDPTAPAALPTRLQVRGSGRWRRAVGSALADLAALRMHDPERGLTWPAAGAPWYLALFGRDALLTAHEALVAGTGSALEALEALAAFQGGASGDGAEPGRILHELRTGHSGVFGLPPWSPYHGSVDATPLFVIVLAEAWRWGGDPERVAALVPAARRAVAWCRAAAAADPRGFLSYVGDADGLHNKGWKDSAGAMVHADGSVAEGPIAVVEAQGYAWRALLDLAELERAFGAPGRAAALLREADELRRRILRDFVGPGGRVAMALDGSGRRLDVDSSNAGHLLWVGLIGGAAAAPLADQVTGPQLRTGWGIRTLAADAAGYDPLSYHRGSIWPHDTALVIDGLARAGRRAEAAELIDGLLDAAEHHGWRLPELYAGFGPDEVPTPVPYPTTCSPQAWSAAAPLALLRTLIGLEPDVPAGTVAVGPALRDDLALRIEGVRLGGRELDLTVDGGRVTVDGAADLRIIRRS